MAADFVIGGPANSREFARAVALSDLLQRALPSYRARHVVKHESAWTDWVTATCEQMGFMDFTPVSIVVYRLLGEGTCGCFTIVMSTVSFVFGTDQVMFVFYSKVSVLELQ